MKKYCVIGASGSIGSYVVQSLRSQGHVVHLVSRSLSCDITKEDDRKKLADEIVGYDGIVFCYGSGVFSRLHECSFDDIQQQFLLHAIAPLHFLSLVLPRLSSEASIVQLGSSSEETPKMYGALYSSVKKSFTHAFACLASEWKDMSFFSLKLGGVNTSFYDHTWFYPQKTTLNISMVGDTIVSALVERWNGDMLLRGNEDFIKRK